MINYLKGFLVAAAPGKAVLDIGGIGISLELPPVENGLARQVGQEVIFYTRMLIREDELFIYGFQSEEERKLFNLVISVSGFGPRLALSLLGIFTVSQLYIAVLEENIPQLCRAHGVGRKAAQRLVLELKEKLPKIISTEELVTGTTIKSGTSVIDDITEALCALGYSAGEAALAVGRVYELHKEVTREELLKLALKQIANG